MNGTSSVRARTDFTDLQKAQIYARDRATCAFSGANLWLLDYGAAGYHLGEWVDHIDPASLRGQSTLDNGICAAWHYNFAKRASKGGEVYLFRDGRPTEKFFYTHGVVPEELTVRLRRFSTLHYSDWFFNRAVWRLFLGLDWLYDTRRGFSRKRDDEYYAKASYRALKNWREITQKEKILSLERRGLVPKRLFQDHKLLLSMRDASSNVFISRLMRKLLPYHAANSKAFDSFYRLYEHCCTGGYDQERVLAFLRRMKHNRFVTPIIRERITNNVQRLLEPLMHSTLKCRPG
jgi:hypothetical protein